ncbi:hypothetical protein TPAU25S_02401 [Tsukamurella paurometabola]|nr:Uncharacterised protein [Tsukamurella paurometabola]
MGIRSGDLVATATSHEIRTRYRQVYRGVRLPAGAVVGLVERIEAALLLYPHAVLCGWTAAALHGAGYTAGRPIEIWLPARRVRAGIVVRCGAMPDEDVVVREAFPLTTGVRTAIDVVRYAEGDDAVAALDQCFRLDGYGRSVTSRDAVVDYLERHHNLHRSTRVVRALRWADGRAESPPETFTRLLLHRAGLSMFVPQVPVDGGRFRLDLAAEEFQVAVEYDGRDHSDPAQQSLDIARRNTLRHDYGWEVLPITASILRNGREAFLRQTRAALRDRGWRG